MTWNASNTLGCAWNVGCANVTEFPSMTFFVCEWSCSVCDFPKLIAGNYWPPGNMATQPPGTAYAENIGLWRGWTTPEQVPDVTFTPAPSQPAPTRTATTGTTAVSSPRLRRSGSDDTGDCGKWIGRIGRIGWFGRRRVVQQQQRD